jgi:hypothetical protein
MNRRSEGAQSFAICMLQPYLDIIPDQRSHNQGPLQALADDGPTCDYDLLYRLHTCTGQGKLVDAGSAVTVLCQNTSRRQSKLEDEQRGKLEEQTRERTKNRGVLHQQL